MNTFGLLFSVWRKMNNKFVKFGVPIVLIVCGLAYLAFSGVQESKSYYVTLKEMSSMGEASTASACVWPAACNPARFIARAPMSNSRSSRQAGP